MELRPGTPQYGALHAYLRKTFPKHGICDECGQSERRTEFALIHNRDYSRNREDYLELCKRCHNTYDGVGGSRWRNKVTKRSEASPQPSCACGCDMPVQWDRSHARWRVYLSGHRPQRAQPVTVTPACASCGQQFHLSRSDQLFCSKACKAAKRRADGRDAVRQECHVCGTLFTSNRYDKVHHCSHSCAARCQHAGEVHH